MVENTRLPKQVGHSSNRSVAAVEPSKPPKQLLSLGKDREIKLYKQNKYMILNNNIIKYPRSPV